MPGNALFAVDAEVFFLKAQDDEHDDDRQPVAEEYFLHEGKFARKVDEQIHQREAERRAEDKQDTESLFCCCLHIYYYM